MRELGARLCDPAAIGQRLPFPACRAHEAGGAKRTAAGKDRSGTRGRSTSERPIARCLFPPTPCQFAVAKDSRSADNAHGARTPRRSCGHKIAACTSCIATVGTWRRSLADREIPCAAIARNFDPHTRDKSFFSTAPSAFWTQHKQSLHAVQPSPVLGF